MRVRISMPIWALLVSAPLALVALNSHAAPSDNGNDQNVTATADVDPPDQAIHNGVINTQDDNGLNLKDGSTNGFRGHGGRGWGGRGWGGGGWGGWGGWGGG